MMDTPTLALKAPVVPVEVTVEIGKSYWWCACGLSKKQPFCDGPHRGTLFSPIQYRATETGPKWFCACKRTGNRPFCDGSHNRPMISESEVPALIKEDW
jgi:CDGSH-type Zn-finger protein